jgi:hypothetical protein
MQTVPWLASCLADPRCFWSMGAFGAIAGFSADDAMPAMVPAAAMCVTGAKSAIRLIAGSGLTPIAFEVLSSNAGSWNHGVALCLPQECADSRRGPVLIELGDDPEPLLGTGRLFDLGLGLTQADICVRTDNDRLVDRLRALEGVDGRANLSVLAALLAEHDHVRVTATRIGRIETHQPRRTSALDHLPGIIPQLVGSSRTHAATTPIPDGLVPLGYVFPPHPLRDRPGEPRRFDRADHDAFQTVLDTFGMPRLTALKARIIAAALGGEVAGSFPAPQDRFESTCIRVALRQMRLTHPLADLAAWLDRFDPPASKRLQDDR